MTKLLSVVLAGSFVLASGCGPRVLIRDWPVDKHLRVAVMPFKSFPGQPESGGLAHEAYMAEILAVEQYDVIERGALEQVLREQKLSFSGMVDESKAIEIGKLLSADAVILGAVTQYRQRRFLMFPPAKVTVSTRLVDTKSGIIKWTAVYKKGGMKRWFTWIVWPIGIVATIISPSVEDQVEKASKKLCRSLAKKGPAWAEDKKAASAEKD